MCRALIEFKSRLTNLNEDEHFKFTDLYIKKLAIHCACQFSLRTPKFVRYCDKGMDLKRWEKTVDKESCPNKLS